MNEFVELLELYLDEEQIEIKKIKEDDELRNYSEHNQFNFTVEDTISISRFVNDYLGIQGDCHNLFHCGLKDLENDYVLGVSNEFANKNPELVKSGWLLLVIDAHHKRGTYINPVYLKEYMDRDNLEEELKLFSTHILTELSLLQTYYDKWQVLHKRIEKNQRFYNMLIKTCKLGKVKKLENKKNRN